MLSFDRYCLFDVVGCIGCCVLLLGVGCCRYGLLVAVVYRCSCSLGLFSACGVFVVVCWLELFAVCCSLSLWVVAFCLCRSCCRCGLLRVVCLLLCVICVVVVCVCIA